ncbi:MAG: hypothetical protein WAN69_09940 [Candidatus Korobacteraceae bacterium]
MKRNMFGALMTLIVAFAVATPMVHAQTIMTANVPFAFSVGQQQLPAGAYAVRELNSAATLIQNKDGNEKALALYQSAGPSKSDETKLVFHKIGDHYFLTEIWSSVRGQGQALPESKLEKEMEASNAGIGGGGVETVIVALR